MEQDLYQHFKMHIAMSYRTANKFAPPSLAERWDRNAGFLSTLVLLLGSYWRTERE